jgi:hypothetical protein
MQQIVEADYQNRLAKQAQPAARTSAQPARAEAVVPPKAAASNVGGRGTLAEQAAAILKQRELKGK